MKTPGGHKAERLYTIQRPGHDLTKHHSPAADYTSPEGAYYEIARFLGWSHWIWCFSGLAFFDNDYFVPMDERHLQNKCMWVLDVPRDSIRWCALYAQCTNSTPARTWFYEDEVSILRRGDIPQALVRSPVNPLSVIQVCPAAECLNWQILSTSKDFSYDHVR